MKIVTMIKPFSFTHNICVYDGEELVKSISTTTNKLEESFTSLAQEFNLTDVEIYGPTIYTKGIKNQIEKAELNKYNKNTLNIILK